MRTSVRWSVSALVIVGLLCGVAAGGRGGQAREKRQVRLNALTEKQEKAGWKLLFDGKTLDCFKPVKGGEISGQVWKVVDGSIVCPWKDQREGEVRGSIVTKEQYGQFEFRVDYKLDGSREGQTVNGGIKYFNYPGTELGLEYQLFTEGMGDPKHAVGDLYALFASGEKVVRPTGKWNSVRIVAKGRKVEHWLNGKKILEVERGSKEFREAVAASKFKDIENFGEAEKGHILLQDHGGGVAFRNIMIKPLGK